MKTSVIILVALLLLLCGACTPDTPTPDYSAEAKSIIADTEALATRAQQQAILAEQHLARLKTLVSTSTTDEVRRQTYIDIMDDLIRRRERLTEWQERWRQRPDTAYIDADKLQYYRTLSDSLSSIYDALERDFERLQLPQ